MKSIILSPWLKQRALLLLAMTAAITACGGGSDSSAQPLPGNDGGGEEQPVAAGSFTDASLAPGHVAKTVTLDWTFDGDADAFDIEINVDGNSGFVTLDLDGNGAIDEQDSIAGTASSVDLLVPLHLLSNPATVYRIVARDQGGAVMDATGSLSVTPVSLNALVSYLKASNTEANDEFGHSLALSGDGQTLAVGAPEEDSQSTGIDGSQANDGYSVGAVYVFNRAESGNWVFQAYVKPSDADRADLFGEAVSLSGNGDTLVVGASGDDGNDNSEYDSSLNYGAAHVFVRDASGNWTQQAKLQASNREENDGFGGVVSLSGDGRTIAVAAPEEDSAAVNLGGDEDNNDASGTGAVYVFSLEESGWEQQAYVKASNTDPLGDDGYAYEEDYGLGLSLSHSGDVLAVAAQNEDSAATGVDGSSLDKSEGVGAVYTYTRDGNGIWSHQSYIKPPVSGWNDAFGNSLSLSGDGSTLAVGHALEDSASTLINGPVDSLSENSGAVHVLRYASGTWDYQAFIKASNANEHDQLGTSVDLSFDGNMLVAGAVNESGASAGLGGDPTSNGAYRSGAVYTFLYVEGQWQEHSYIKAMNVESRDYFGSRVALSDDGGALAVAVREEDSNATGLNGDQSNNDAAESGAVFLY